MVSMNEEELGPSFVQMDIEAPREKVWEVLTAVDRWQEIISTIESVEILSGSSSSGPFSKGLRWNETRVMMGQRQTETLEVTWVDEAAFEYSVKSESCGTTMMFTYRLQALGPKTTRVAMWFDTKAVTWMAWFFAWMGYLMRGTMRKMIEQDMQDVKTNIEVALK